MYVAIAAYPAAAALKLCVHICHNPKDTEAAAPWPSAIYAGGPFQLQHNTLSGPKGTVGSGISATAGPSAGRLLLLQCMHYRLKGTAVAAT